jgi:creatinine amidohydrolase
MVLEDVLVGGSVGKSEGVWLEKLTWVEAEEAFGSFSVVLIPLGARVKEHGLHLPLNNDWVMAEYLSSRVAEEMPVLVMPTLQYGYYPSFLEYPGSVSINWETFKDFVKDICRSVRGYGVNKFYVLNTGISTLTGLKPAAEELLEEGIIMRYTDLLKVEGEVEDLLEQEGGTHADEGETSMMLYIKPEIVDMNKAVKDFHPLGGRGLTRDPENTDAGVYSETGVYGDPTLATREKGRILTENLIENIKREILDLISV